MSAPPSSSSWFSPAAPPFSLSRTSRHDLNTYGGRLAHFSELVDLRNNLLTSADIAAARATLAASAAAGGIAPPGVSDASAWAARLAVASALHPDTGEAIPLAFRLSAFMPVNLPICGGMLLARSARGQLFAQFVNQTYNSAFNYANRNATVPTDWRSLAASYVVATGTAVGAAAGLGRVVARMQAGVSAGGGAPGAPPPLGVRLLSRALPWFAVATAGAANVVAMRYKEAMCVTAGGRRRRGHRRDERRRARLRTRR